MAWTYTNNPANVPRDAVRLLVGDTDTTDQKATDEAIAFFLAQAGDDTYLAAALTARSIAAIYAVYVDTKVESVSTDYGQLSENYYKLATEPVVITESDNLDEIDDMKELRRIADEIGAPYKVSKADQRQAIRDHRNKEND